MISSVKKNFDLAGDPSEKNNWLPGLCSESSLVVNLENRFDFDLSWFRRLLVTYLGVCCIIVEGS